jgi:hypothetical protein
VSQNNRLIERHAIPTGYFWTSYDFAGNKDEQSLFKHPLGPEGPNAFKHDGGESIWSLPNGFQGYSLTTAEGKKLDKGPTQIVRDLSRKDLTVTNGISCMGCHDQGIRKAKDDVRAQVLADRTFSTKTRKDVEALYPTHDKMDALLEADGKRFTDAMKRAGLDPTLKLNGIEMINALAARFEANVDGRLAAAELGLSEEEFRTAAAQAGGKAFALQRRLEQNIVPRDQFEADFSEFVELLTDDDPLEFGKAAPAKKVAAVKVAKVAPAKKEVARTFDLSLTADRRSYRQNDRAIFTVVSKEDCNLTLINEDDRGEATILFPNKFQTDKPHPANREFRFGDASTPFTLPPRRRRHRDGDRRVQCVAQRHPRLRGDRQGRRLHEPRELRAALVPLGRRDGQGEGGGDAGDQGRGLRHGQGTGQGTGQGAGGGDPGGDGEARPLREGRRIRHRRPHRDQAGGALRDGPPEPPDGLRTRPPRRHRPAAAAVRGRARLGARDRVRADPGADRLPDGVRWALAAVLIAAAAALFAAALGRFRRAGTHVEPWRPSTALVTDGVYGRTRNPIYLGMTLAFLALALAADSAIALLALVPLLLVIQFGVIAREERYLAVKFGDAYARYASSVRRWL